MRRRNRQHAPRPWHGPVALGSWATFLLPGLSPGQWGVVAALLLGGSVALGGPAALVFSGLTVLGIGRALNRVSPAAGDRFKRRLTLCLGIWAVVAGAVVLGALAPGLALAGGGPLVLSGGRFSTPALRQVAQVVVTALANLDVLEGVEVAGLDLDMVADAAASILARFGGDFGGSDV